MTRVTATDLARHLSELLNRVEYRDEAFEVERNGRVVARIVPADRAAQVADLFGALEGVETDAAFADALEAIQSAQGTPRDPWGS